MKDDLHSGSNGLTFSLTWLCDFSDVPVTRPTETKMSLCACVCSVLVWPDKFQARCNTKITLLMHQHKHSLSNTIQLCTNGCSFVARKLPGTENTTTWRYQACIADTTECLWMVTEEALCGKLPGLPLPAILSLIDVWASCWVQPCISWGTWKFALLKHLHLLIYRHINLHQRFNKAQLQKTRLSLFLSLFFTPVKCMICSTMDSESGTGYSQWLKEKTFSSKTLSHKTCEQKLIHMDFIKEHNLQNV